MGRTPGTRKTRNEGELTTKIMDNRHSPRIFTEELFFLRLKYAIISSSEKRKSKRMLREHVVR